MRPNRGENLKNYAVAWVGSSPDNMEVARRSSPLTYVRKDDPPIITSRGDHDDVVPYGQAARLHGALDEAGVTNQLFTIKVNGHGQFADEKNPKAYEFLAKQGLRPSEVNATRAFGFDYLFCGNFTFAPRHG